MMAFFLHPDLLSEPCSLLGVEECRRDGVKYWEPCQTSRRNAFAFRTNIISPPHTHHHYSVKGLWFIICDLNEKLIFWQLASDFDCVLWLTGLKNDRYALGNGSIQYLQQFIFLLKDTVASQQFDSPREIMAAGGKWSDTQTSHIYLPFHQDGNDTPRFQINQPVIRGI